MLLDPLTRRAKIPAWTASMLFHAAMVLLLLLWVGRTPQGAAEETTREFGIVLKTMTTEGVQFDGENDALADQTADIDSPNPIAADPIAALPDLASNSTASDALPALPGIGPLDSGPAEAGAASMTQGGGTTGGFRGDVGEKSRVRVFGVEGVGTKFVYLFDRSTSMEGDPLIAAKQQLIESLGSLQEIHHFQIIFFNTRAPIFTINGRKRIAYATDQNKRIAAQQVSGVVAYGGTDRLEALERALAMEPDVIFFLTDIDDGMSLADLQEVYRLNNRAGAMISTIEFGRGPSRGGGNFLKQLAARTGGGYVYVNTSALGKR